MTLFQPLWPTRPGPEALQQGWEETQRAQALNPPTDREQGFLAAAEAFFRDPGSTPYWERIGRWEQAMQALYERYPDDQEVAAFYALAHLATAPSEGNAGDHQARAAEILEALYAVNPGHPGASHYLIHANDVQGRQHEALDVVRGYGRIAPANPHALHMPTHIYTRLGEWDGVIEGNLRAAEAALAYPAGADGAYVWDEFPHAVEYLVYAYLQQGDDAAAAAQLERLRTTQPLHPTFKTAFHVSSIPARFALERGAWDEAAMLVPRPYDALDWDHYPWPEAVTWFARGLGAARSGQIDEAQQARERLLELEETAAAAGEELFTRQIRVLRFGVTAWVAQAQGDHQRAREQMTEAVALEASTPKHPVTPAPTLPAAELLGDLLLAQDRPAEALASFQQAMALYPGRFNSVLGAARAARALGDAGAAGRYYEQLLEGSTGPAARPALDEARTFMNGGGGA
jgi:tetratricopeptide (TPR) repeat protein